MKKIVIIVVIIVFFMIILHSENNWIGISKNILEYNNLPKEFDGLKIVQISDLHNKEFGKNQEKIISKVKELKPDIIVITGDLVDSKKYNLKIAMELIEGIKSICPVYFVNGNHEWWSGKTKEVNLELKKNITTLQNEKVILKRQNSEICIIGIDSPESTNSESEFLKNIESLRDERFTIFLSHRPEYFEEYEKSGYNLVFSGHAHGGQFRIPIIGGLIAPNQGFFPKYTTGIYKKNNTQMVVSRGLGNSIIPQRILNRPEIIEVELRKKIK